jgi:hypothetical protein
MKIVFFTLALMGSCIVSAQNKPLSVRFLPTFSTGKSQSSQTMVSGGSTSISKTKEKTSKQIKTKNVMRFGEYTVTDVSFNSESVELSASHFLKFVTSKLNTNSLFTVQAGAKKAVVTTSDNVTVEGIGSSTWTDLIVPFKSRLINTGIIKIDSTQWEYFVEDRNFLNNSTEEVIGYLSNGKNKIEIKLHNRSLTFSEANQTCAVLKFPLFKTSTVWLEEKVDSDTQLAISAVCSAVLLKIRGVQQID